MQTAEQILESKIAEFFRAFVSSDIAQVQLGNLKPLFMSSAVIVKTCGGAPVVASFDEFIEPRQKILTDGTLLGFSENAVSIKTDRFGDIAQSFVLYRKSGRHSGEAFDAYGMKSFQFVRFGDSWKINSILWDDERPGVQVENKPHEKKKNQL